MNVPTNWGASDAEVAACYPCDGLLEQPDRIWFRAVSVNASPAIVFRWLCQLRYAPYSYDLIDNLGHRSPQRLTPGAENLLLGQSFMTIFRLKSFARDQHLTLSMHDRWALRIFGNVAISYVVHADGRHGSRLVAKLLVQDRPGLIGALRSKSLAWGDLLMMRRQLLNIGLLAESAPSERETNELTS